MCRSLQPLCSLAAQHRRSAAPRLHRILAGDKFPVSFAGHFHWSFRGHGALWLHALPRFAAVALSSFAGNELLYAALLAWTPWHPGVSLFITLLVVAASTFALSRGWAFVKRH